jgi:release factor glutamine methyltransferase
VAGWEPREALVSGADGLEAIRALIAECVCPLSPTGIQRTNALGSLALEVGEGQAPAVAELLCEAGFGAVESRQDLAGIERVVIGAL